MGRKRQARSKTSSSGNAGPSLGTVGIPLRGPVDPPPLQQTPWWPFTIQGLSVAGKIDWDGSTIASTVQGRLKCGFHQVQIRLRHVKVWGAEQTTAESVTTEAYLVINRPGNQANQLCAIRDSGGRNRRPMAGWAFSAIDRTRILPTDQLVMETSGSYWEISGWIRSKGDQPPAFSQPGRIIADW